MPGERVFLDADGDGRWNPGEYATTTDPDGAYAFGGLPAGAMTAAPSWRGQDTLAGRPLAGRPGLRAADDGDEWFGRLIALKLTLS